MDNTKTGVLIRELRKEQGMTQKNLADLLHITDKAISKWERGLCAPDISLLEPLAKALNTTVIELIGGERIPDNEHSAELEANTRSVLDYSIREITYKTKWFKKKYICSIAIVIAVTVLLCMFFLWWEGYFYIIDRNISPNQSISVTVYDKALAGHRFSFEDATSIIVKDSNNVETRITYGDCIYQGIWWAPDSNKYVISLKYDDRSYLALAWLEKNVESNLTAYLSLGVEMNELAEYGLKFGDEHPLPEIQYQFLQWSSDSTAMLIYYAFTDVNDSLHSGYFWYNCEDCNVYATFELGSDEQPCCEYGSVIKQSTLLSLSLPAAF